jgi:hypothetical protein
MPEDSEFMFNSEEISLLVQEAQQIIANQPVLVKTESPTKIFGDIHG